MKYQNEHLERERQFIEHEKIDNVIDASSRKENV